MIMRESKLVDKRLYDLAAGVYCGVVVPEHVMKKLVKLQSKYQSEVRKTLDEHKGELYKQDWTLANKKDEAGTIVKQVTIKYALITDNILDIENRIKLFKPQQPEYISEFYLVDSYEQAKEIAEEILREELEAINGNQEV